MKTPTRIGITLVAALALGVTAYGSTMTSVSLGTTHEIWRWGSFAAGVLAIVGVAFVNRWWAVLPAVVPTLVSAYIFNLTDFSTPWENESLHPIPAAWLIFGPVAITILAALLSLGFLLRPVWLWGWRWYRSNRHAHLTSG